jgi:hypothetical protein
MRRLLITSSLIFMGLALAAPATQNSLLQKKLLGAWRLTSVDGERFPGYDHPTGLIIYDPSGKMSVQIANRSGRKTFAGGFASGTREEKAAAFDSYYGYYGTYSVDAQAGTVTHHIEDFSYPDLRGRDNVRWVEFHDADHIVLIPIEDGKGGRVDRKVANHKLFWERVKR